MAQFPMGGFFNRPQQNIPYGRHPQQFGQMPRFGPSSQGPYFPQQNVPRGTFQPNFSGPPPQRGMPPQMPQMPPQQNMPPMHMLNPTNDPNVRFEPVPGGMMPPNNMPQQPVPSLAPSLVDAGALIIKLSDLTQGESNSITFYENLSRARGIGEKDKELVAELLNNKRQQIQGIAGLYRDLTNSEWSAKKDMKVEETRSFRGDIAYALIQESRLLREASQIYADLNDKAHQKTMNMVIYSKIADIAHLMAL